MKKLTKDERMAVFRKRTQSAMARPNRTDDLHTVLKGTDVPKFFKTTTEKMPEQHKHDLYLACDAMDKDDLEKIISIVGPTMVPRLR